MLTAARRRSSSALTLAALVAALGCGRGDERLLAGLAAAGAPTDPALVVRSVQISFDGAPIATVSVATLGTPVPLLEAIPARYRDAAAWIRVEARSTDGRILAIPDPATRYHDHVARLYRGDDGWPALGWWMEPKQPPATARPRPAGPRLKLVRTAEVRIWTRAPEPAPLAGLVISIEGGAPIVLGDDQLRALPTRTLEDDGDTDGGGDGSGGSQRRGEQRQASGWRLLDVLAAATTVDQIASVTLHGADGAHVTIGRDALVEDTDHLTLKRNRTGELMFRSAPESGTRQRLRGVTRIEVSR